MYERLTNSLYACILVLLQLSTRNAALDIVSKISLQVPDEP